RRLPQASRSRSQSTATASSSSIPRLASPWPPRSTPHEGKLADLSGFSSSVSGFVLERDVQAHPVVGNLPVLHRDAEPRGTGAGGEEQEWRSGTSASARSPSIHCTG